MFSVKLDQSVSYGQPTKRDREGIANTCLRDDSSVVYVSCLMMIQAKKSLFRCRIVDISTIFPWGSNETDVSNVSSYSEMKRFSFRASSDFERGVIRRSADKNKLFHQRLT